MFGLDKPRALDDDEHESGPAVRQWLIEYRLYGIQKALYVIAVLLLLIFLHAIHPEWGIWHLS